MCHGDADKAMTLRLREIVEEGHREGLFFIFLGDLMKRRHALIYVVDIWRTLNVSLWEPRLLS